MAIEELALPAALLIQGLQHLAVDRPAHVVDAEQARTAVDHLVGLVAGNAGECAVDGDDACIAIGQQDAFGGVVEHDVGQALLVLGLGPVADVDHDADGGVGAAVWCEPAVDLGVDAAAIAMTQAELKAHVDDLVPPAALQLEADPFALFRVQQRGSRQAGHFVLGIAEHVGRARVAVDDNFVLHDVDAGQRLLDQRVMVGLQIAQPLPLVAQVQQRGGQQQGENGGQRDPCGQGGSGQIVGENRGGQSRQDGETTASHGLRDI